MGAINRFNRLFIAGATVTALAQAAAAELPATNEENSLVIEEIVVTATKYEAPLQDVPMAITAITEQEIVSRGLTQYADILSSVPGVYYEDAGPGNISIHIRELPREAARLRRRLPRTSAKFR